MASRHLTSSALELLASVAVTSNVLTIGQLAQLSGLTTHTIRYYESAGVLKPSIRAANGHRRYQQSDVLWIEFVLKLKLAGMPLEQIRQYADLRAQGEATLQQRMSMLKLHRDRLAARMAELSACSQVLDDKISSYRVLIAKAGGPTRNPSK